MNTKRMNRRVSVKKISAVQLKESCLNQGGAGKSVGLERVLGTSSGRVLRVLEFWSSGQRRSGF